MGDALDEAREYKQIAEHETQCSRFFAIIAPLKQGTQMLTASGRQHQVENTAMARRTGQGKRSRREA